MIVIIDMEIETPDYEGKEFMKEINKLLEDIRKDTCDSKDALRLVKFKMCEKFGTWDTERDIDWVAEKFNDYHKWF